MGVPEVPRVSDPSKEPEKVRRHTEVVANIINALQRRGDIVKMGPADYTIFGGGGLTPGTFTNTTIVVSAGGVITSVASGSGAGVDPISSIYPVFTPAGSDDEFTASTFPTGWTAVNSGSHTVVSTESNNVLSLLSPGSDVLGEFHAWMKAPTITTGSYVQAGFRSWGFGQTFNSAGVLFANGTTYGAGAQACFYESMSEGSVRTEAHTNYNTQGVSNSDVMEPRASRTDVHLKLVYNGANSFTSLVSPDGISWVTVRTQTITLTPTAAGFFVSTQGGTKPYCWSFRYVRFG